MTEQGHLPHRYLQFNNLNAGYNMNKDRSTVPGIPPGTNMPPKFTSFQKCRFNNMVTFLMKTKIMKPYGEIRYYYPIRLLGLFLKEHCPLFSD